MWTNGTVVTYLPAPAPASSADADSSRFFQVNDRIEAKLKSWARYYVGVIAAVDADRSTVDILFDDGDKKANVSIEQVRKKKKTQSQLEMEKKELATTLWHIRHDDGDEEDLEEYELVEALDEYHKYMAMLGSAEGEIQVSLRSSKNSLTFRSGAVPPARALPGAFDGKFTGPTWSSKGTLAWAKTTSPGPCSMQWRRCPSSRWRWGRWSPRATGAIPSTWSAFAESWKRRRARRPYFTCPPSTRCGAASRTR